MRLHTHDTQHFIQSLAAAISKDPASMASWRCLHVPYRENRDVEWYGELLKHLQESNKDTDCDVVYCADDDLLFLSREVSVDKLYALAKMFILASADAEGKAGDVALYDVAKDWRLVRDMLLQKVGTPPSIVSEPSTHFFGDIAALHNVFNDAKNRRRARHPLHVMLVEDDLLTQRIASSAFKENYALITASTALEAVANYIEYAPDIVFLDIGLPDATGFDVLKHIMATDHDAYVVMFSGNSQLENIATSLSQGASGFIAKPFKQERMRHYILESAHHHHKQF